MRTRWAVYSIAICLVSPHFAIAKEDTLKEDTLSVAELVNRGDIPLANLSPNGRFVAYLVVRGVSEKDSYAVTVRVATLDGTSFPQDVVSYTAASAETYGPDMSFLPSAGDVRWLPSGELLITAHDGAGMRLLAWNPHGASIRTLLDGYDRLTMSGDNNSDVTEILATRLSVPPRKIDDPPPDRGWEIRDNYAPLAVNLQNPTLGQWSRTIRYHLSSDSQLKLLPAGSVGERWDRVPFEWKAPKRTVSSGEYRYSIESKAPDTRTAAGIEFGVTSAGSRYRVTIDGGTSLQLDEFRNVAQLASLGWAADSRTFFVVSQGADGSAVYALEAKRRGRARKVLITENGLSAPCDRAVSRTCRTVSFDGRTIIAVRSTISNPAELVALDTKTGKIRVLDDPNVGLASHSIMKVKLYKFESSGVHAWARLYLPSTYRGEAALPLVVTQYRSLPGYPVATGDEVPIPLLVQSGIAVLVVHLHGYNYAGSDGNFDVELDRVRRAFSALRSITSRLIDEQLVDRQRIGLGGVSYGAEISMYAYSRWPGLRTVSVATGSWDPALYSLAGPDYASYLDGRFPDPNGRDSGRWAELTADLHGGNSLPTLLIQSPDGERLWVLPTWTRLRKVGLPVEWIEYPDEGHVKRNPANRWWVYKRNLDWFRFWLQDWEDDDPSMKSQYFKWRHFNPGNLR